MPHKPLDCLSRASPPGPTIYCYLQCERTRSALPAARRTFSASRCTKGRWLRSPARGALGTGGGSQPGTSGGHGQGRAIRRLGQLNGPRQAPLTQRPRLQGGPFPLQPPRRGASGPCPPRAAALGHGQLLLPRSAGGTGRSPEPAGSCRCSARPPVALGARRAACHAGSVSRSGLSSATSRSSYSIATGTTVRAGGGRSASLPPRRGGAGAAAGGGGGGREVMHSAGFRQPPSWRFI